MNIYLLLCIIIIEHSSLAPVMSTKKCHLPDDGSVRTATCWTLYVTKH